MVSVVDVIELNKEFTTQRKETFTHTVIPAEMPDERAMVFVRELRSDLRSFSTVQVITLLRIVLSKLRSCHPIVLHNQNFSEVPALFQFLFVGHWSGSDHVRQPLHLDELVQELTTEDKLNGWGLFKSEVETQRILIRVLNRIASFFKHWGIHPYPYTLAHELQQASQG